MRPMTMIAILLVLTVGRAAADDACPVKRALISLEGQQQKGAWSGGAGPSALAMMAYLGAGHSHRFGPYKQTVKEYMKRRLKEQTVDGRFGPNTRLREHAMSTLALIEGYGQTRSPLLKLSATRAADYLATQLQEQARWEQLEPDGYPPLGGVLWAAAALESARRHKLQVSRLAAARQAGLAVTGRALDAGSRPGAQLAAARYFCGADVVTDKRIKAVVARLRAQPATATEAMGAIEHWAATCLMAKRGDDDWKAWSRHIKARLIDTQIREQGQALTHHWKPRRPGDEPLGPGLAAVHTMTLQLHARFARALR